MCECKKECYCKKHLHAELMMQYAQDAMETNRPWERWQFCKPGGIAWWQDCVRPPIWDKRIKYRRKPCSTININGYEVPEPLRTEPYYGKTVYFPSLSKQDMVGSDEFFEDRFYRHLLKSGLLHSTREAAEIHAKALLSFTSKEVI